MIESDLYNRKTSLTITWIWCWRWRRWTLN